MTGQVHRVSGRFGAGAAAPADAFLAADACSFAALRGQDVEVSGVGVAPAQIGVQCTGLHRVVRVFGCSESARVTCLRGRAARIDFNAARALTMPFR